MTTGCCGNRSATPIKLVLTEEHSSPLWQEEIAEQKYFALYLDRPSTRLGTPIQRACSDYPCRLIHCFGDKLNSNQGTGRIKKECDHYFVEHYFETVALTVKVNYQGDTSRWQRFGLHLIRHPVTQYAHWGTHWHKTQCPEAMHLFRWWLVEEAWEYIFVCCTW